MKVAVILKGQSTLLSAGAGFFKDHIEERFNDIEFKVFQSTWPSISKRFQSFSNPSMKFRHLDLVFRHRETLSNHIISSWNPESFEICSTNHFNDILLSIIEKNSRDIEFQKWFADTYNKSKYKRKIKRQRLLLFMPDLVIEESKDDGDILMFKKNTYDSNSFYFCMLNLHYMWGQIFSFFSGLKLAYENMKTSNWQPDLIWVSRPDIFTWFRNDFDFKKIKDMVHYMRADARYSAGVTNVRVPNGQPWISDLNMFFNPVNISKEFNFLDGSGGENNTIDNYIIDMLTNEKISFIDTVFEHAKPGHGTLPRFFRETSFDILPNHVLELLIRPGYDPDLWAYRGDTLEEKFINLRDLIKNTEDLDAYDRTARNPTAEEVYAIYRQILNN